MDRERLLIDDYIMIGDNMISLIKQILVKIFGNRLLQRLLDINVYLSQYLMGIGSGTGVGSSGEKILLKKLKQMDKEDFCIFDVGSNTGQFLDIILSSFTNNENVQIHCFEPSSSAFRKLKGTKVNNANVVFNNIGLGKEKGKFDLFFDNAGSGLSSLTKRNLEHFSINFSKSEKVIIDTLDNYCRINKIEKIGLLKIDVEGHELDVLNGALNMLQNRKINMISFEFGGCNIDTRTFFQDFYYFFMKYNFELFRITPAGGLYPIEKYKEIFEQFRTTNFLAIAAV